MCVCIWAYLALAYEIRAIALGLVQQAVAQQFVQGYIIVCWPLHARNKWLIMIHDVSTGRDCLASQHSGGFSYGKTELVSHFTELLK